MKKKKIQRLLLLTLLTFVLTGCRMEHKAMASQSSHMDYTGLRMLHSGDEHGMYLFNREGSTKHPLVCYIDYATKQGGPLCKVAHCHHDRENCTAWLPIEQPYETVMGGDIFVLDADSILQIYCLSAKVAETGEFHSEWRIDRMHRDGTKRQNIYAFRDGEKNFSWMSGVDRLWADDEAIYFYAKMDMTSDEVAGLYRLPLTGGEPTLCLDEATIGGNVADVWNEKFLLYQNVPKVEGPTPEEQFPIAAEMSETEKESCYQKQQELWNQIWSDPERWIRLSAFDPKTGEVEQLVEWQLEQQKDRVFVPDGDRLWWVNQKCEIGWMDTDGSEGSVVIYWPQEIIDSYADTKEMITLNHFRMLNGQLLFAMDDPYVEGQWGRMSPGRTRYAVDVSTGQVKKMKQSYAVLTGNCPVQIWAVSPDWILVQFAENQEKLHYIQADGTTWNEMGWSPCIGVISPVDFLAGKTNYIEIKTSCDFATWYEIS